MEEYKLSYLKDYSTDDMEAAGDAHDTNYYSTDKSGHRWDIGIYFGTTLTSDKETNPEVLLNLFIRLNYDQISLSWEDGAAEEFWGAPVKMPSGYVADDYPKFKDLNVEYDFLDADTEEPMDIVAAADLLGVSKESLNAFILDLAKKKFDQWEDEILDAAIEYWEDYWKSGYDPDDYYESLDDAFKALNSLNEVFDYKEEEILSDEEVKELNAKLAELESQYKEAIKKCSIKREELEAAGLSFSDIYEDPEYKKLDKVRAVLRDQFFALEKKLDKHNTIIKYQTTGDQIATEDDWDTVVGTWDDIEVEVEIEIDEEEGEYLSGWNYHNDSVKWTSTPARHGILHYWTISVDVTKEMVADFLEKKVEEVTVKDIMNLDSDYEDFAKYLAERDDVIKQARKEAKEAVEKGNYDDSQVDWDDWEDDGWDY